MGKHKNLGEPSLVLMEECAEVIQVIAKLHRFKGTWNEVPEGKDKTRWQELCDEMEDVLYQWERLKAEVVTNKDRMVYYIYHPKGGVMNYDCTPGLYMYDMVYKLQALSFEDAYRKCQNGFNEAYTNLGIRSTSVGDIIMSEEDYNNNRCHLVKGMGFQDVPSTWISYIDWSAVGVVDLATIADKEEESKYLG